MLLTAQVNAWTFTVYPDSECESTASGSPSGTDDSGCTATPANHRSFEIDDMGSCELYLFADEDDCDDGEAQQFYDATDEDECIPPDFTWDYYYVIC